MLAAVAALVATARVEAQTTPLMPPTILTSAIGEARAQPDRATIMFAVETRASTAAAAGSANAKVHSAVIDTIRSLGIAAEQISTLGYTVTPEQRSDGKQVKVVGYVARNAVRIDVRRIDQVGGLIDASLGAGANMVSSLRFFSSREEEVRREALAAAVTRARADAEVMAKAAGGSLGNLYELSAPVFTPFGEERGRMVTSMVAADAVETPINPGEQSLRVSVTARWVFIPGK
jgi:uncharacterized protein